MNNIRLLTILCFFSVLSFAQNTDSSSVAPASDKNNPPVNNEGPANYTPNRNPPPHLQKKAMIQEDFWKKVYWGGNLALSLGNGSGYYELSPNAGYKFNKVLSAGPQIIYQNYTYLYGSSRYNFNIYGGGVFGRALVLPMLFFQVEYDILSVPDSYSLLNNKRAVSDEKLVGLGLKNSWGNAFSYYITILYDVNPSSSSPYYYLPIPIVTRAGFNVNF
ncbi:MAG: hypothetical protein ACXVC6_13550 [Bacteroidia bacterium]